MTSDTFTANPLKTASSSETAAAASSLKSSAPAVGAC